MDVSVLPESFGMQFPLHSACKNGDSAAVDTLLQLYSDTLVWYEDTFRHWTPLHWAASFGQLECLKKMLTHSQMSSSYVSLQTNKLQTPLHLSASGGHANCLRWLLDIGANVHCKDYLGETAAHKASRVGSVECLSLLSARGIRLSERNNEGLSAGDLAEISGNCFCADYLRRAAGLQQDGLFPPFDPKKNGAESSNSSFLRVMQNGSIPFDDTQSNVDFSQPSCNGHSLETNFPTSYSVSASEHKTATAPILHGAYGFQPLISDYSETSGHSGRHKVHVKENVDMLPLELSNGDSGAPFRKRTLNHCNHNYGKKMKLAGFQSCLSQFQMNGNTSNGLTLIDHNMEEMP